MNPFAKKVKETPKAWHQKMWAEASNGVKRKTQVGACIHVYVCI